MKIEKKNEVYIRIETEPHIARELSEYFTFEVPGARFMPSYRNKVWDGKIRLFSVATGQIYLGLLPYIREFCKRNDIRYELDFNTRPEDIDESTINSFIKHLKIPYKARDYQISSILHGARKCRGLFVCPTASGKSLIIYGLTRWCHSKNLKTLIIVPTTSLVEQMYSDFLDYGWLESYLQKIYQGHDKKVIKDVVISTWQSLYKFPKKYFEQFGCVIGDEAHTFKSKSLTSIMNKLHLCKYRFGLTGTLDDLQTHKLVLEGVFGTVNKVTKTEDLIKEGHLSEFQIKVLMLKHEYQEFDTYQDEMEYICADKRRNRFIRNLVCDLEGNTLVLFNYVEKHGMPLFDLINKNVGESRQTFLIYGGVDTEDREKARRIAETTKDSIIVASYGTFSTGINIRNLHNVVFASPSKSRIRNLQSIGRVLRKGDNKRKATLYDIADDISKGSRRNYTLNHLIERVKIYNEESFDYEFIDVNLKTK